MPNIIPATPLEILKAEALTAGVMIEVSTDFEELIAINQAAEAAGTWDRILPASDYRCRDLSPDNAFWLKGVNDDGDVVTVQVVLYYDCTRQSMGERWEQMTTLYDVPAQAPAGEWCVCVSKLARGTVGHVVWATGGWTRPDYRGRRLLITLNKIGRILAWEKWTPDWIVGVVDTDVLPAWAPDRAGPHETDPIPGVIFNMDGVGRLPMHFIRFVPADLDELQIDRRLIA